jgi:hypothetical protein
MASLEPAIAVTLPTFAGKLQGMGKNHKIPETAERLDLLWFCELG